MKTEGNFAFIQGFTKKRLRAQTTKQCSGQIREDMKTSQLTVKRLAKDDEIEVLCGLIWEDRKPS